MQYHVVSYGKLPLKLRINGLSCSCKSNNPPIFYGIENKDGADCEVWGYYFSRYGEYPRAQELYDYGPWLAKTDPFFVEIEMSEFMRMKDDGSSLPRIINIENRIFTRFFDRYFLMNELKQDEIEFFFDYMAPTYNADITYEMNFEMNQMLLSYIAMLVQKRPLNILDFGIGTAVCASAMPEVEGMNETDWNVTGLDISKLMVEEAKKVLYKDKSHDHSILKNVHQIKNNEATFINDCNFDAAMACFTIQYFLDLQPYKEIYRLLKWSAPFVCNVFRNDISKVEEDANKRC